MNVLSLFDGISCARVALQDKVKTYYACEIDKYAIQIAKKNYPDTIHLGDVKTLNISTLPNIDLLIGGSPCQDLSIAKKNRQGLEGSRSSLFWEYVRIKTELNPTYFILENVASMPKEAKDIITKELGVEPIMIDASLVSAQSRKRYFWTNIPNITQPEDREIKIADILETDGVIGRSIGRRLKDGKRCDNDVSIPYIRRIELRTDNKSGTLTSVLKDNLVVKPELQKSNKPIQIGHIGKTNSQGNRVYSSYGKSVCLSANGGGGGAKTGLYDIDNTIRKLTPVECERLQSLPDNYTEGISNTQRYKCLGNAFNTNVIKHILRHLPEDKI
jgi:DNA (cytosine-5)-methyltransferase 3A